MSWMKNLFSSSPEISSMRVVLIVCVITAVGIGIGGLIYILWNRLDPSYIINLTGLVGIYLTSVVAKVIQSFSDNKVQNTMNSEVKNDSKN